MNNHEWRVIVKRKSDNLKWRNSETDTSLNKNSGESNQESNECSSPNEKVTHEPKVTDTSKFGGPDKLRYSSNFSYLRPLIRGEQRDELRNDLRSDPRSDLRSDPRSDPRSDLRSDLSSYQMTGAHGTFKRRFTHDEREIHKAALNKARKYALTELQLPKEWIENKLEELMYKIDPRTQTPASGFFESFHRLRKFGYELKNQTNNSQELPDMLTIDNHEFSREHFYTNNYFQIALVDYYWNLLKTETTFHSVKVIYHQNKPHLKISFQDTRNHKTFT